MTQIKDIPSIIQGGMGAGISNWKLAREVSLNGGLGTVAGTALDQIMVRRLQDGDVGGHMRRALEAFPIPEIASGVMDKWFFPKAKPSQRYKVLSRPCHDMNRERIEVMIVAAFAEVFLAKEGHNEPVGFNCLEKIQMTMVPSIFGAMLAGVDVLVIGAGLPVYIPKVIDCILLLQPSTIPFHVEGKTSKGHSLVFDPNSFVPQKYFEYIQNSLKRPLFLPVISSALAGKMLLRKNKDSLDGFIVENQLAGGHNAPARKKTRILEVASSDDEIDLAKIAKLGKPFWLAGGYSSPSKLKQAINSGACGIQVGTLFAFSEESGLESQQKIECKKMCLNGEMKIRTDFFASPTGYPFKIVEKKGTMSDHNSSFRAKSCDLGYLQRIIATEDSLNYRCPALEPESKALCVCNGLMASAGLGQIFNGQKAPPLLTCGENISSVAELSSIKFNYTSKDVLNYVKGLFKKSLTAS